MTLDWFAKRTIEEKKLKFTNPARSGKVWKRKISIKVGKLHANYSAMQPD